jgi:uncharacterized protein
MAFEAMFKGLICAIYINNLLLRKIMAPVLLIRTVESDSFEKALEDDLKKNGFKLGQSVAVKLHMGEGKGMFRSELAKRAVDVLKKLGCKPFLFDTVVLYPGPRHFKAGYKACAALHGYTEGKMGCPIVISDDYVNVKTDHMDVEVSREMSEADAMLVLTHFKGHGLSGFGGSIKNIAMGCASPKSKGDQHKMGSPTVNDKCVACGVCRDVCPFHAIKITETAHINFDDCFGCGSCVINCPHNALDAKVTFERLLCEATWAALAKFEKKPVYYVNDVRNITKHCDCFPFPGEPIAKDVGLFLSNDIVAIDKASLDISNKQEGKNYLKEVHFHDPYLSIEEAERMGLGKKKYSLEEVN